MGASCSRHRSADTANISDYGKDRALSRARTDVNDVYGSMMAQGLSVSGSMTAQGLSVSYDNSVKFCSRSGFAIELQSENFNSECFSGRHSHAANRSIRSSKRSNRSQSASIGEITDWESSQGGFNFRRIDSRDLPPSCHREPQKEMDSQTGIMAPMQSWRALDTGAAAPLHRIHDAELPVALSGITEANSPALAILDQASQPVSAHRAGSAPDDSIKKASQDDAVQEDVRASTRFIVAAALALFLQKSDEDAIPPRSRSMLASEPFAAADLAIGSTLGSQLFGHSPEKRSEDMRQAAVMDAIAMLHVACDAFKLRQSCILNVLYILARAADAGICFDCSSYRTLLLTALLISIKEYKECAVWASDLRVVFPSLQLSCLSHLEPLLLSAIDYQVSLLSGDAERELVVLRVERVRETEEARDAFHCAPVRCSGLRLAMRDEQIAGCTLSMATNNGMNRVAHKAQNTLKPSSRAGFVLCRTLISWSRRYLDDAMRAKREADKEAKHAAREQ